MKVQTLRSPLPSVAADILAVGLLDGDVGLPTSLEGTGLGEAIRRLVAGKDLPRSVGEVVPLLGLVDPNLAAGSMVAFGLGEREKLDDGAAFSAGVALGKKTAGRSRDHVAVAALDLGDPSALVEGLVVGTRSAGLRKSEPSRHPFGTLSILEPPDAPTTFEKRVLRGQVVGDAVNLARDLANTPPAEKGPTRLASLAREVGEAAGLTVTVWDEAQIREERFGGLLGVSAGSDEPPAFVILEHLKGGDAPTLALVGKGVTFDSGGLSLKPSASMEDMKCDMTGAAVVLAAMAAISRLGVEANVVGYLPMTENMVNGRSMKLGDVLTHRNGKTVEILNTDAEGRLILADALSYATERDPAIILDLATLTGACIVALGTKVAGLFSNDDARAEEFLRACRRSGEPAWRMPLVDEYREMLKSQVADLKNVGGKWGGAITAAKFLEEFVDGRPWIHLDIAGPSWAESDGATRDSGGTGCFVRTIVGWIEDMARH